MDEFAAKKLAEVEAFLRLSGDIVKNAGAPFLQDHADIATKLQQLASRSVASEIPESMRETFDTKATKTTEKLGRMMELYIGDEWGNPVEVLEWSSFFAGAAAAHCALASELDSKLRDQLDSNRADFEQVLQQVISGLRATGKSKKST